MSRQVGLLRGVNLGAHKRLGMADLKAVVQGIGYTDVETHLQSGNVVFGSSDSPTTAARRLEKALADHARFEIDVLVRSADELAEVVACDPLRRHVTDPRRYLVSFLSAAPDKGRVEAVDAAEFAPERFHLAGRELYLWLPKGVHKARLPRALSDRRLGVVSTARNWNTVEKLLALAAG